VDTTATVERKVAALMCHKSQMPDPESVATRVLDGARAMGELAGLPEGSSAEQFRVTRIP
jgi:LmbE family N-acetylglucosaminyl deacetylase